MKLIYQADNSNRTAVFSDGLRVLSGVGKRCVVYTQVEKNKPARPQTAYRRSNCGAASQCYRN